MNAGPPDLIAEAENEDRAPDDSLEGAGVFSSLADLNATFDQEQFDPGQAAVTAVGLGLDALGTAMDPLGALGEAGIGWLIEHIWWLHEPLDALAGDPTQIAAQAQTWHNVSAELRSVAADHVAGASALSGWNGDAADAYRVAVSGYADRLGAAADSSESLASLVLSTGAMVGTVRALIRDKIAELVWDAVCWLVGSAVSAVATVGGSVAVAVSYAVLRALLLAQEIARRLARLFDDLEAAGGIAGELVAAMRHAAAYTPGVVTDLRATGGDIEAAADTARAGALIEFGKQQTGVRQSQRGWE